MHLRELLEKGHAWLELANPSGKLPSLGIEVAYNCEKQRSGKLDALDKIQYGIPQGLEVHNNHRVYRVLTAEGVVAYVAPLAVAVELPSD